MSVIGNRPVSNFQRIAKQTITGTGATAYSLDRSISSAADLAVFVNNVRQEPGVAYTAATTTITFSEAITGSDTVYVLYIGQSIGTVAHPGDQALSATTGTFSDALSGTTGTFSGALSATSGTFTGALSGTTGTFTGDVYAPGHVIQTVTTNSNTRSTTTSTSYVAATDLSAAITPKSSSSKILVLFNVMCRTYRASGADSSMKVGFSRDGGTTVLSPIRTRAYDYGSSGIIVESSVSASYLDSPATTSALTYQIYYAYVNGTNATVNNFNPDSHSSITLMEIAQ